MVTWTWTPPLDEPVHICTELGEDDPDSFMPDEGQLLEDEVDLSHIPPRLLSICFGVDKPILILSVCPSCRDVSPPAGSCHTVDICAACHVDLFLPSETVRSNITLVLSNLVFYMQFFARVSVSPQCGQIGAGC